jgi:hypothetical protein
VVDDFAVGGVELQLAGRLGEVDEVDLRFLVLAEGFQFELVAFAGGEGDDVFGGLGEFEVHPLCEIHEVLLVLVG